MTVFDRDLKRAQRDRAATFAGAERFDYLRAEVAARVVDRLDDIGRDFESALDLGCGPGDVLGALAGNSGGKPGAAFRGGVRRLTLCDSSRAMLGRADTHSAAGTMSVMAAWTPDLKRHTRKCFVGEQTP